MARVWTCRGCGTQNPRVKQKCTNEECGRSRPAPRRHKNQLILDTPYEWWVERYGERCGICGRPPGLTRRLDRDHDHRTGKPRGLLCHRHNRLLGLEEDPDVLVKAAAYLRLTYLRDHEEKGDDWQRS